MTTSQTPLQRFISNFENKNLTQFKPEAKFYETVKINRVRFWQLVRGEKPIFAHEIKELSHFFGVSPLDFFNEEIQHEAKA